MVNKEILRGPEPRLGGKVVVVTGAAKGIGRGIAIEMAKEGAVVVIADIDDDGSKETEKLLTPSSGKVLVVHTDVRDDDQNTRLVDEVLERFGTIDVLVNNAGINTEGGILDITKPGALDVFKTNLVGPFFLTQRVAQEMVRRRTEGCLLFTSSIHGQVTQLHPAYTATKAALEMFVRDVALDLAEYQIRVNAVAPGAIAIRDEKDRTSAHVPMGYRGTPADIAHMMVFLASEKGSYITGQTITIDGGLSLAHVAHWVRKGIL